MPLGEKDMSGGRRCTEEGICLLDYKMAFLGLRSKLLFKIYFFV